MYAAYGLPDLISQPLNNQDMKTENEVPRRIRLDLNTPAELAIYNAMQEVEKAGADPKLTEAVILLQKAKDLVSDFVDLTP